MTRRIARHGRFTPPHKGLALVGVLQALGGGTYSFERHHHCDTPQPCATLISTGYDALIRQTTSTSDGFLILLTISVGNYASIRQAISTSDGFLVLLTTSRDNDTLILLTTSTSNDALIR